MGCSRDSYRPLAHWHADGRCRDFFDEQEVPSQSTSGSVKDEPSNHESMRDQLSEGKEGVDTAEPIVSDDDSEAPSETESYLDLVALDVPCHHCRRKNRYAKMKCTNILGEGNVCQMEFCHMCIYQRFLTFLSPLHPLVDIDVSPQKGTQTSISSPSVVLLCARAVETLATAPCAVTNAMRLTRKRQNAIDLLPISCFSQN